jgi:Heterokaryon incompatibility protein (HET)
VPYQLVLITSVLNPRPFAAIPTMRLINTKTLELEEFIGQIPEYIILSHTWGKDEISFTEFQKGKRNDKITNCCKQARKENFDYAWVDTSCIDKTSSAELSEAINSMYRWYQKSAVCYAYLEDFSYPQADGYWRNGTESESTMSSLEKCRWFTRGWTLQELVAPPVVEFYDRNWVQFGTRVGLQTVLSKVTRIPVPVLARTKTPQNYPVAARMSWAARRKTTRQEDEAYCLMGFFDIHMPMLYGEGGRAFQRLQEEILKQEEDYTLFAWPLTSGGGLHDSVLASSPSAFDENSISPFKFEDFCNIDPDLERSMSALVFRRPPTISSRGVSLALPLLDASIPLPPYIISPRFTKPSDLVFTAICQIGVDKGFFCIVLENMGERFLRRYWAPWYSSEGSPTLRKLTTPIVQDGWMTVGDLQHFRPGTVDVGLRIRSGWRGSDDFLLDIRMSVETENAIQQLSGQPAKIILDEAWYDFRRDIPLPTPGSIAGVFLHESGDESSELIGSAITVGLQDGMPWCALYQSESLDDIIGHANDHVDDDFDLGYDLRRIVIQGKAELIAHVRRSGSTLWPPAEELDPSSSDWRWQNQRSYPRLILETSVN